HDLRLPVSVDVPGGDADAAAKGRLTGQDMGLPRAAVTAVDPLLAEDADLGLHPGPGRRHELRTAVPVEVGERHPDAALEQARVGAEARHDRAVGLVDRDALVGA